MTYQVRKDPHHNRCYIATVTDGDMVYTSTGLPVDVYRFFDKILFEGTYKEAYKYFLENICLEGEPI